MIAYRNILKNTLSAIIIHGNISSAVQLVASSVSILQTISLIVDQNSDIFRLLQYFQPNNYLHSSLIVIIGFSLCLLFIATIALKLLASQKVSYLISSSTLASFIGTLLLHLQVMLETIIIVPLFKACLLIIQNPQNPVILSLSIITLFIGSLLLLPILLYNSSNTFIFSRHPNRKLNYWNTSVWISVGRIVFIFGRVFNQAAIPFLCAFFTIVYVGVTIKRPIFTYTSQKIRSFMGSTLCYFCIARILNAIISSNSSILADILGFCCFAGLIEHILSLRIKHILERQHPSIFQFKLLLYLVGNLEQQIGSLEYFILNHYKKCNRPTCFCSEVIKHLSNKESSLKDEVIWYQFLEAYIKSYYNLQEIAKLSESQIIAKITNYQYIVGDLAEILLFKLEKLNEAYYILSSFQTLIEKKKIQSIIFQQKRPIMNYYLEQAISKRYKTVACNEYADKFMKFQIQFDKYRRLLLKTANKTAELWEEMNKKEPYGVELIKNIKTLETWNTQIRTFYKAIVDQFQKADDVLEGITNDYFRMVLNITQNSPFHLIEPPPYFDGIKKKKAKVQRLSQNMQAFSYDSETPMCFVSVQDKDFGKIKNFNSFFSDIMKLEYGRCVSIDEFIIPEMRKYHHNKMVQFINGDYLSRQHKNGFTLNLKGKIVYTKILIQIMPLINQGISYVIFFRKLMYHKKIIGIKNMYDMIYQSQSLDEFMEAKFRNKPLMNYLTPEVQQELQTEQKVELRVKEGDFDLLFMHKFTHNQTNYLFLQIVDINEFEGLYSSHYPKNKQNKGSTCIRIKDQISCQSSRSRDQQTSNEGAEQKADFEQLKQKQQQKQEIGKLNQLFKEIFNKKERSLSVMTNNFMKIAGVIRIILLIVIMLVKNSNQYEYIEVSNIHAQYNNFMMLLSRYALNFKIINFYAYQNVSLPKANSLYAQIQKYPYVGTAMDAFLYNFDIQTVSQNWPSFSVNNNTFSVSFENNFLTVTDNVINPVVNLNNLTTSNFSFPFALSLMTKPITPTASFYFQLTINIIYNHLFSFRKLKTGIMDSILRLQLNNYYPLIALDAAILIVTATWIIWIVYKHRSMILLKQLTYKFLQSLKIEFVCQKQNNCHLFLAKHLSIQDKQHSEQDQELSLKKSIYKSMRCQDQSQVSYSQHRRKNSIVYSQTSKMQSIQSKSFKNQRRSGEIIFKTTKVQNIVLQYVLPCIFLIVFMFIHSAFQVRQNNQLNSLLQIQKNLQKMRQDIIYVRIYAMQYAAYSPDLQKYQSIPGILKNLITQLFAYEKFLINTDHFHNLPLTQSFVRKVFYGDICKLQKNGTFSLSDYYFDGKGNETYCMSINNQMLSKGLISSLLNYVESANTLVYENLNISTSNLTQKIAYLNDIFFKDIARMSDYFELIYETALKHFFTDYQNYVSQRNLMVLAGGGVFIGWLFIIIFFFRRYYLSIIKWDILQIHSMFTLISYESVLNTGELKEFVTKNIQRYHLMK